MNYGFEKRKAKFPLHASASDSLELEIFMPSDEDLEYSEAFYVHPTDELPMLIAEQQTFEFSGGKHLEVLINPSVIKSDNSLKTLAPSDRSCYFEDERKLQFFKVYTKHNCEIECLVNATQAACGCVPFFIVRDADTRVCGISPEDLLCASVMEEDFRGFKLTDEIASCSCLSPCDLISYDIEIIESQLREPE